MIKDAFFFLIPILAGIVVAGWLGSNILVVCLLVLFGFVSYFFRDPNREISTDPLIIVSPADGRVVRIEEHGAETHLSIFLSIFDVHVNRSPISGTITGVNYKKGKFRLAFDHKASTENEQNTLTIRQGQFELRCSQIAGLIARRIVCWKKSGDSVERGERIGFIRFGSRVDLILPMDAVSVVQVGDKVYGGSSVIAKQIK